MKNVVLQGLRINENVVKVHNNTSSNQRLYELSHNSHVSVRGICEPKWNYKPLKESIMGFENRFPLITQPYPNLVVSTMEINLRKDSKTRQII